MKAYDAEIEKLQIKVSILELALAAERTRREKLRSMLDEILCENPSCSCFDWSKAQKILEETQ